MVLDSFCKCASDAFVAVASDSYAISWVEFVSAFEGGGCSTIRPLDELTEEMAVLHASLHKGLRSVVLDPVDKLLIDLVSPSTRHNAAVTALQEFAPTRMLPHLGLLQTRSMLSFLGASLQQEAFPSNDIRCDCWEVGVET